MKTKKNTWKAYLLAILLSATVVIMTACTGDGGNAESSEGGGGGNGNTIDPTNSAPVVTIVTPTPGTVYNTNPATINFTVNVSDPDGDDIASAQINVDTTMGVCTFTAPAGPYTCTANVSGLGAHVITATATDVRGATGYTASPTNITIDPGTSNNPPTVTITNPSPGSVYSALASFTFSANPVDPDPGDYITRVEFYINGTLSHTAYNGPWAYNVSGLAAGSYQLNVKAYDSHGAWGQNTSNVGITVNPNQPPTGSIIAPAHGTHYDALASFTVIVSVYDEDGQVTMVELLQNGSVIMTDSSPNWSFNLSGLAAGTYQFTARLTDDDGATFTTSAVTVYVDNVTTDQPPTVALTSPDNNSTHNAPANVILAATATDDHGISNVRFYLNGNLVNTDYTAPYSYVANGLAAGTYTVYAVAEDTIGQTTQSASRTFTVTAVDQPPTVTLTSPDNNSTHNAPANVILAATATDDHGISNVRFYLNGNLVNTDVSAPYSFNLSALAAGTYTVYAIAEDTIGQTTQSAPRTFTVIDPDQPPTVALTSPDNNSTHNAPANVILAATATDDHGISNVRFYLNGNLVNTDVSAPYSFNLSALAAGTYTVYAVAEDTIGQTTQSASRTFTVIDPDQPPTVALTSPDNNSTHTAPANVTLAATATDDHGISNVRFYLNGNLVNTDVSAPYSFNLSALAAGTYTVYAVAEDTIGQTTQSASRTFTVTAVNQPPTVTIVTPTDGATYTEGTIIPIQANILDSDGTVVSAEFRVDGVLLTTDLSAPWQYNWTSTPGTHVITVHGYDNDGAAGNDSVTIQVGSGGMSGGCLQVTYILTNPKDQLSIGGDCWSNVWTQEVTVNDTNVVTFYAEVTAETLANGKCHVGANFDPPENTNHGQTQWFPFQDQYSNLYSGIGDGMESLTALYSPDCSVGNLAPVPWITEDNLQDGGWHTIFLNNTPPTVSITSPSNASHFNAPANFVTNVVANDADDGISKVELWVNGTLYATDLSASYQFTMSNLAAGTYTLVAKAYDTQGVVSNSAPVTVYVDAANQPPTVTLTAPADYSTYTAPANVTFAANASDNSAVGNVKFYLNGNLVYTDYTAPYSYTANGLTAGTYTVYAIATDDQGLTAQSATHTFAVSNANQPPTVTLTAPANNSTYTAPANVTFAANASDNSAVSNVKFYLNGNLVYTDYTAPYSYTANGLTAGTYTVYAIATDDQGLTAQSATHTFTVSNANQPPTVTLTSPANNSSYDEPASVSLAATATDDHSVSNVKFYLNGNLVYTDYTAPYSYTANGLTAGTYTVYAIATDDEGLTAQSATHTFTVNATNQSPTVEIISPLDGETFTALASFDIDVIGEDNSGINKVDLYQDGNWVATDNSADWSFPITNYADGSYDFYVVATANDGETVRSATVTVYVVRAASDHTGQVTVVLDMASTFNWIALRGLLFETMESFPVMGNTAYATDFSQQEGDINYSRILTGDTTLVNYNNPIEVDNGNTITPYFFSLFNVNVGPAYTTPAGTVSWVAHAGTDGTVYPDLDNLPNAGVELLEITLQLSDDPTDICYMASFVAPNGLGGSNFLADMDYCNTESDFTGTWINIPKNLEWDFDGDGTANPYDNCIWEYNPDQTDSNNDGVGNACTGVDNDNDGFPNLP